MLPSPHVACVAIALILTLLCRHCSLDLRGARPESFAHLTLVHLVEAGAVIGFNLEYPMIQVVDEPVPGGNEKYGPIAQGAVSQSLMRMRRQLHACGRASTRLGNNATTRN